MNPRGGRAAALTNISFKARNPKRYRKSIYELASAGSYCFWTPLPACSVRESLLKHPSQ